MAGLIDYVVGFLCDETYRDVVLIEKQRPTWQKGRLNGVGGHVELGELSRDAMRREFQEEAALDVQDWKLGVVMTGGTWRVGFFSATGPVHRVRTQTDEPLRVVPLNAMPVNTIPNLRWLIPLCIAQDIKKPVHVCDMTEPSTDPKAQKEASHGQEEA